MSDPKQPGPPFDQPQAPYEPFPAIAQGSLDGTPRAPDFARDKQFATAGYPVHMLRSSGLMNRCEPILTPELLVSRYLKGIPLTFPNGDHYNSADLKDQIGLSMNEVELLCRITLTREQFWDKPAFDTSLFKGGFIHMKTEQGPILSVEEVSIVSSDGFKLFTIPSTWIEPSGFSKGFVNVVPLLSGYGATTMGGNGGIGAYNGFPYMAAFAQLTFIPGFWSIGYTAGVSKIQGQLPIVVNDLVGTIAAINIISAVAVMFLNTSQSLSRDGVSQSSSSPGPRVYALRIEELEKKKTELMGKIRAAMNQKFLISNI